MTCVSNIIVKVLKKLVFSQVLPKTIVNINICTLYCNVCVQGYWYYGMPKYVDIMWFSVFENITIILLKRMVWMLAIKYVNLWHDFNVRSFLDTRDVYVLHT